MQTTDRSWSLGILVCPGCRGELSSKGDSCLLCVECGREYGRNDETGVWDLRFGPKEHRLRIDTGAVDYASEWNTIQKKAPETNYRGPTHFRTIPGFLSVIQDRVPSGGIVLEIGCGSGDYREAAQSLGLRHLGVDYESRGADLLADAHALPIGDRTADVVILPAVTQALESPRVACGEAARVLKDDGLLVGTADSGATFVLSFFHITPWGLISLLRPCGIVIERIWCLKDALDYFGTNPGYPRLLGYVLRFLSRISYLRFLTPRLLFGGAKRDPFITAGSIAFIGRKRAIGREEGSPFKDVP